MLTEEGASLLDPSGDLQAGIPLCPPEGDAGTGMVATNSVAAEPVYSCRNLHICHISSGKGAFQGISRRSTL